MELGLTELLFLFIIAVIILGPDKLPEFARTLGRYWREFIKLREIVQREIQKELEPVQSTVEEFKGAVQSIKQSTKELTKLPATSSGTEAEAKVEELDSEIKSLAEELGINTENKSKDEVLREIRERIKVLRHGGGEGGATTE